MDKEGRHTAGPWTVSQQNGLTLYIVGNDQAIAEVLRSNFNKETFANADLIAAAPDIYDLLRRIISDLPAKRDWLDPEIERRARELLTKIGETP